MESRHDLAAAVEAAAPEHQAALDAAIKELGALRGAARRCVNE